MSVLHTTAAGPVVLHERDAAGWNVCPYCVLDRISEVSKVVGDQARWSDTNVGGDTGSGEPSTTDAGGESGGDDAATGDRVPTDCTDELFSLWQACRSLASLNNPSGCGPCADGKACENAACSIDCADLVADYPQCASILDQPLDPYSVCVQECITDLNQCRAALAPGCDATVLDTCNAGYSPCLNDC